MTRHQRVRRRFLCVGFFIAVCIICFSTGGSIRKYDAKGLVVQKLENIAENLGLDANGGSNKGSDMNEKNVGQDADIDFDIVQESVSDAKTKQKAENEKSIEITDQVKQPSGKDDSTSQKDGNKKGSNDNTPQHAENIKSSKPAFNEIAEKEATDASSNELDKNLKEEEAQVAQIKKNPSVSNSGARTKKIGKLEKEPNAKLSSNSKSPAKLPSKEYAEVSQDFSDIKPLQFRIYSHNVKNGGHKNLVPGELSWRDRYLKIASSISFNSPENTIVTLQEVYQNQLVDILKELNRYPSYDGSEWSAYGAGRINGKDTGEFVPILYKNSEWEMIFNDTIWLNEKNRKLAIEGWDAKYLRIASIVTLRNRATKNYINLVNTHFDHVGEVARLQSAKLLAEIMKEINEWPSFLCGDLNFEPSEISYKELSKEYTDSAKLVTEFNNYGHVKSTVTGFEGEILLEGGQNIDYIFCPKDTQKIDNESICEKKDNGSKKKLTLKLQRRAMLHTKFNGVYMSDHRPIVADFLMTGYCIKENTNND